MKYLIILLLLANTENQDQFRSRKNLREGNRYEGYADQNLSSSFKLLGFHRGKIPNYESNDVLNINFFLKYDSRVDIKAQKIIKRPPNYKMEVIKKNWTKGWNTFTPWSVNTFLLKARISSKELAVIGIGEQGQLVPCIVSNKSEYFASNSYKLHYLTPYALETLSIIVTGEEPSNSDIEVTSISYGLEPQSSNSIGFRLDAPSGLYQLKIAFKKKGIKKSYYKSYKFYHKQ